MIVADFRFKMLSNLPFGLLRCIERTIFYPPILYKHHDWECISKRGQLLTVFHQILYFYLAIHLYPRALVPYNS